MNIRNTVLTTIIITALVLRLSMMGKTPAIISAVATVGTFSDRPAEAHQASPVGPRDRFGILGHNPPDSTGDRDADRMCDDAGPRPNVPTPPHRAESQDGPLSSSEIGTGADLRIPEPHHPKERSVIIATGGNRDLYTMGRSCSKQLARHTGGGLGSGAASRSVASDTGLGVKDVRAAIQFTDAVDEIARNAGPAARRAILSGHRHLTPKRVMQISRTHPERQRYAMAQVAQDRHPFAKPTDGSPPPFDTLDFGEVTDRLARFAGLLDRVANGLADTPPEGWPAVATLHKISARNAAVRESCVDLREVLEDYCTRVGLAPARVRPARCRPSTAPAPFRPDRAFTSVSNVLGVMRKNLRDMPRLLRESPPTAEECASVLAGLRRMDPIATKVSRVIRGRVLPRLPHVDYGLSDVQRGVAADVASRGHGVSVLDAPDGPADWGGTYIVIFHLNVAADVTVGCGRTFALPPGFHLYVGIQYGPGGVRGRTRRHLTPVKQRNRWNVDFLTPHARAVELWWTHDPIKRECTWSSVLASSPEFDCPAPGFGSNDCRESRAAGFGAADGRLCQAHLYHSLVPPDAHDFARRLGQLVPGHAPMYRQPLVGATSAIELN